MLEGTLKLDQAALNGESEEAKKTVAPAEFQWMTVKLIFWMNISCFVEAL